jgi:hypothetical protein
MQEFYNRLAEKNRRLYAGIEALKLALQLPKYSMCDLYLQKKYNPRVPIAVY